MDLGIWDGGDGGNFMTIFMTYSNCFKFIKSLKNVFSAIAELRIPYLLVKSSSPLS